MKNVFYLFGLICACVMILLIITSCKSENIGKNIPQKTIWQLAERTEDISKTCGLKVIFEGINLDKKAIKLLPLLSQAEAEAIPSQADHDAGIYYNQNEDVYTFSPFHLPLEIACENRMNGKEYIANGWG